jgi:hypothetical protein
LVHVLRAGRSEYKHDGAWETSPFCNHSVGAHDAKLHGALPGTGWTERRQEKSKSRSGYSCIVRASVIVFFRLLHTRVCTIHTAFCVLHTVCLPSHNYRLISHRFDVYP